MNDELSPKMKAAIKHMAHNSNKIVRFPGGYWAREGWHSWNGPCWGTSTIEGIVRRGYGEYTVWKDGRGGKFPIECGLTQRALDWLTESAKLAELAQFVEIALHGLRSAQRAAEGAYSCACGDMFPDTPFCLVCGNRVFTPCKPMDMDKEGAKTLKPNE